MHVSVKTLLPLRRKIHFVVTSLCSIRSVVARIDACTQRSLVLINAKLVSIVTLSMDGLVCTCADWRFLKEPWYNDRQYIT